MLKLRFAILGAAAALALGAAGAVAMEEGAGDAHGDAVASAARTTCPNHASGVRGVHGECVSDIASAEGQENREGAQSDRVQACKAKDATEDKTEKAPAKGDKAAIAADRIEDRAEQQAFVACLHAG